ncbi:MAG: alpha/beta fold hydrolase, partial [Calditrichaeota bacterium]
MRETWERERPVTFLSKGKRIFGILHCPEQAGRRVGVIFLNSGPQYRVGPHRLYVKAARELARVGFHVLRMDFPGIGDSEGDVEAIHFDCYDVEDTRRGIDYLQREEKMEHVVLLGTCAGARNALKTAAQDPRVDAAVLWSLPMITFSLYTPISKHAPGGAMSSVAAKRYLKNWTKKALSLKAWKRYLSSAERISPKTLLKSVAVGLVGWNRKVEQRRHQAFFRAFQELVTSGRHVLFVYGEKDVILREEFESKFARLRNGTTRT